MCREMNWSHRSVCEENDQKKNSKLTSRAAAWREYLPDAGRNISESTAAPSQLDLEACKYVKSLQKDLYTEETGARCLRNSKLQLGQLIAVTDCTNMMEAILFYVLMLATNLLTVHFVL